jgi:hypothetical protein
VLTPQLVVHHTNIMIRETSISSVPSVSGQIRSPRVCEGIDQGLSLIPEASEMTGNRKTPNSVCASVLSDLSLAMHDR